MKSNNELPGLPGKCISAARLALMDNMPSSVSPVNGSIISAPSSAMENSKIRHVKASKQSHFTLNRGVYVFIKAQLRGTAPLRAVFTLSRTWPANFTLNRGGGAAASVALREWEQANPDRPTKGPRYTLEWACFNWNLLLLE